MLGSVYLGTRILLMKALLSMFLTVPVVSASYRPARTDFGCVDSLEHKQVEFTMAHYAILNSSLSVIICSKFHLQPQSMRLNKYLPFQDEIKDILLMESKHNRGYLN